MVQAIERELDLIVVDNYEEADYIMFHPGKKCNYDPDLFNITLGKLYDLRFEYDEWVGHEEPFVTNDVGRTCLIDLFFQTTLYKKNSQLYS